MGADASPPRRRARSRSRSPARGGGGGGRSRWERDEDGGDGRRGAAATTAARPPPPPAGARGGGGGGDGSRWERGSAGGGRWPGEREEDEQAPRPPSDAAAADAAAPAPPPPPLYKPNFEGLSGKLAAEANTVNGVVLKFAPPSEARACKHPRWRVYVFKDLPPGADGDGDDDEGGGKSGAGDGRTTTTKKKNQQPVGDPIALDRYPYYLFGKERRVADIPTDHPSCSRQHAVVCFREVERLPEGGLLPSAGGGAAGTAAAAAAALAASRQTLPYLMDLETANGTFLNGERIEASRFYELLDGDVVKFGASTREYVFIRER